jgi:hypothetical protein
MLEVNYYIVYGTEVRFYFDLVYYQSVDLSFKNEIAPHRVLLRTLLSFPKPRIRCFKRR